MNSDEQKPLGRKKSRDSEEEISAFINHLFSMISEEIDAKNVHSAYLARLVYRAMSSGEERP